MQNELELDCDQRKAHVHSHQLFFFLLADSLIFLDNGVTLQSNDQSDRQKLYGKSWEAKPPLLINNDDTVTHTTQGQIAINTLLSLPMDG